MIATESTLWDALRPAGEAAGVLLTRMEVSTALGVGDVEYVGTRNHGWVELKIAGRKKTARTQCEFTLAQAQWLLSHNRPKYFLRSWLLIAHADDSSWAYFTLLEPQPALALLWTRAPLTWEQVHARAGAYVHYSLEGIMRTIT